MLTKEERCKSIRKDSSADLHAKIMNIKADTRSVTKSGSSAFVYKMGHRDARHAAAELVVQVQREEYKDHEFCKSIECCHFSENGCGCQKYQNYPNCIFTAKDFHKWLKANGYKIVKEGE